MFEHRDDYAVPLLRLLADLPGGAGIPEDISERFLQRFGSEIPSEGFEAVSSGAEKWWYHVAWTRFSLKTMGFIDAPERGVWRISQAGRDWLNQNPGATRVSDPAYKRKPAGLRAKVRTPGSPESKAAPVGMTLSKLERIRQVMPSEEFSHDWGEMYGQLLAAERAMTITPVDDRYLVESIRPLVHQIQDFLLGRSNESPKSEVICDWIFICYSLKLLREGASLWRYVNKDEVNAWQYERTARLSAACRTGTGS